MTTIHAPAAESDADLEILDVNRDTLVNREGVRYRDFRRGLTPRYAVVWRDIIAGHLALIAFAALAVLVQLQVPGLLVGILTMFACGIVFGYIHQYLNTFLHEAAHYNLASDRALNDRLCNGFVSIFLGVDARRYRPFHFDHHRYIGTPRDTEITYFSPLTPRRIAESLFGIVVLRYLLKRWAYARAGGPETTSAPASKKTLPSGLPQLVKGLIVNGLIVAGALALGWWVLAGAWVLGIFMFYPVFQGIRQTLEHRDEHADPLVDYRTTDHGEVNRLFGDGPIANTFGSAGFNRHLLHHWDPQVSYTRLRDLETFLMDTDPRLAAHLDSRRTTYLTTFRRLFLWRY